MKITQNASILFWLYVSNPAKDGSAPVICRITIDYQRAEFDIGQKIKPEIWEAGQAKGTGADAIRVNKEIAKVRAALQKKYDQIEAIEGGVTAESLKSAYLGITEQFRTIIEVFEEHNKNYYRRVVAAEPTLKPKSWQRFDIAKEKIREFLKAEYNCESMRLDQLKSSFGNDLLGYLTTTGSLKRNTAMKYLKITKQVFLWASKKEYLKNDPMAGFKCSYRQPKRVRLTWDELMHLYNLEISIKRLEEVRDVFVFGCFTGYSYMDIFELQPENIILWIDGTKWLVRDRFKGEHNKSNVPLMDIPLAIINKYKTHPLCLSYNKLLPVKSNERYNSYLKELANIAGINKELSTHSARHTFATTILIENDCPIESVSDMLGHNSIRTTQIYANVTDVKVSNDIKDVKTRIVDRLKKLKTGTFS